MGRKSGAATAKRVAGSRKRKQKKMGRRATRKANTTKPRARSHRTARVADAAAVDGAKINGVKAAAKSDAVAVVDEAAVEGAGVAAVARYGHEAPWWWSYTSGSRRCGRCCCVV